MQPCCCQWRMAVTLTPHLSATQLDLTLSHQHCRLMEIESRLLPCGLHVVGSPPTAMEAIATLVNIAEIDRPEGDPPVKGLPGILARSINRNMEEIYLNNNRVSLSWHFAESHGMQILYCCPYLYVVSISHAVYSNVIVNILSCA